jgi:cytochrome P450
MGAATDELYYDPISHKINADPYALYKRMRNEQPLYYNKRYEFYALTRYSDVLQARFDWKTFASGTGVVFERILDPTLPRLPMLEMDPPEHRQVRKVVTRRFSNSAVQSLEPKVRALCAEFLDPFAGAQGFDFMAVLAKHLPMMVTCLLLGIERSDQDELRLLYEARDSELAVERARPDLSAAVRHESILKDRLLELARERVRRPRDDMMSAIVHSQYERPDGTLRPLTEDEIGDYILLLFSGGNVTTSALLGWTCALIGRHPGQRALLHENPSLIPNAVEEILRYEGSSTIQCRRVIDDVTYYGQTVPKGSVFLLLTGAACRDEREYPDPDVFNVRRKIDRHLAFGWGLHACIGAALARLEARIVLEEMLLRFPRWEIDEQLAVMRISSNLRGYNALPVLL